MNKAEKNILTLTNVLAFFSLLQENLDILYCNLNDAVSWEVKQGMLDDCIELSLYNAKAEITAGNKQFMMDGSYLILFDLSKGIKANIIKGSYHYITIKHFIPLDDVRLKQQMKSICEVLENGVYVKPEVLEDIFYRIRNEYFLKKPYYKNKISLMLRDIILETLRSLHTEVSEHVHYQSSKHTWVVNEVMDYLSRNYSGKVKLNDIANLTGYTPRYIDTMFKRTTGYTIIKYLIKMRVESTKKTLISSNKPITEIALESGFDNSSYFCKVFRLLTGISPSEYRTASRNR